MECMRFIYSILAVGQRLRVRVVAYAEDKHTCKLIISVSTLRFIINYDILVIGYLGLYTLHGIGYAPRLFLSLYYPLLLLLVLHSYIILHYYAMVAITIINFH